MTEPVTALLILAGSLVVLGLTATLWRGRWASRRRRDFLEVHPRYRGWLRRQGLVEAGHFLNLSAVVVSGHPDRNVARLTLSDGVTSFAVFLKREHRVPWMVRLTNALAGFGFASRSLREARTLQALVREGVGCPEWLAAGEDNRGRAFLLVRAIPGTVELRTFLREQRDPAVRRRAARGLGAALARLHGTGFAHPDLYAKHVLTYPDGEAVHFLDWQRTRRQAPLGWRRRARDLAALHATLGADLAASRERLLCLRAYQDGVAGAGGGPQERRAARAALVRWIELDAGRLLKRRHIREKRQAPLTEDVQEWICLDGEALCVTPALRAACPRGAPEWLALGRQPAVPGRTVARRWLAPFGEAARALLVWRRRLPLAAFWPWGRRPVSPEQRSAELLLRLQRHAVPAPRVLAMGQRRASRWRVDSFLLTEGDPNAVRLTAWLGSALRPSAPFEQTTRRRRVLRETGALLHRLHDAGCYLDGPDAVAALALRVPEGAPPVPVIAGVEQVRARRRAQPGLARRDLAVVGRALTAAGCGKTDVRRFLVGYRRSALSTENEDRGMRNDRQGLADPGSAERAAEDAAPAAASARPVTPYLWTRIIRGMRRLRERVDWPGFAGTDWPDRIMDVAVTDRFHAKQGRSTGRWRLDAPARPGRPARPLTVYLKRHYRLPWWQGLLATLWPRAGWSPAFQEWEHLEWARRVGVPVPEVAAAAEYIGPWGRLRSFLAVEELTDMLPLHEAVPLAASRLDPLAFRRWKRGLIAEMARLTRLLHDRRCFHKDLYLCHFYIARDDTGRLPSWRGRVFLIDLHRLTRHPWTWRWWQLKDLAQLMYSTEVAGVDARDRLFYWHEYRGPGPRRRADRWLRWCVLFKWRRYRRHNARRKAGNK